MSLPAPSGPCAIGTVDCRLRDDSRPSHLAAESPGRQMFIKIWYPAEPNAPGAWEPRWAQLRDRARTPLPIRACLKVWRAASAARIGAPLHAPAAPGSVVVYHHGLVSFASENSSLMECLASEGHVVLSIEHQEQLAELKALNAAQPAERRREQRLMQQQLRKAGAGERGQLAAKYYEAAGNANRIVVGRAQDTLFVLRNLDKVLSCIPGASAACPSSPGIHFAGFSLGGAVATEAAGRAPGVRAVVNMDGGWYGSSDRPTLRVPYLMAYSEANDGLNAAFLPEGARLFSPPDTRHLNYHDVAGVLPWLRHTGALGRADASAFLATRNRVVTDFLRLQDVQASPSETGSLHARV